MTLDYILASTKPKHTDKNIIVRLLELSRKKYSDPIAFFDALLKKIKTDRFFRQKLREEIRKVFGDIDIVGYMVNSGIIEENNVLSIFKNKLMNFILPEIEDDHTLQSVINEVFYNLKNFNALKMIPKDRWTVFFNELYFRDEENKEDLNNSFSLSAQKVKNQLIQSIAILSDRISGGFSDKEVMRYNIREDYTKSLYKQLALKMSKIVDNPESQFDFLSLKHDIILCQKHLQDILEQKHHKGISLKVSTKLNRLHQQLERLKKLLSNVHDFNTKGSVGFYVNAIKVWIENYSPKNWVSDQLSSTLYQITYLATNHNGKTGEKYITQTANEYLRMFLTALAGGVVVAVLCFINVFIGNVQDASPLFSGFFYSLNFAIGFVLIYLLKWTLATKQPSMTAARLSNALIPKHGDSEIDVKEFTTLFAQLSRSQLIAFIGNILSGFFVALGIYYLLHTVFGFSILKYSKAFEFWNELYVMDWKIFYYAGITGVFLFISGLVSGLSINRQRYNNYSQRVYNHPLLKKISSGRRKQIANWYERNNGGIVGNLVLGILMGTAFLIGEFTGIPFDIRHVSFSAGNLAIGVGGLGYHFDPIPLLVCFISVFLIGWFNLMVSFTLSLMLAMRSNNIPFYKIFYMIVHTVKAFFKSPLRFFFPPIHSSKVV